MTVIAYHGRTGGLTWLATSVGGWVNGKWYSEWLAGFPFSVPCKFTMSISIYRRVYTKTIRCKRLKLLGNKASTIMHQNM